MATVYFLYSENDHQWYIGQTTRSIEERFQEHCAGYVKATKARRPLQLAYFEYHPQTKDAKRREWHLKHPSGYKEKQQIIALLLLRKSFWPVQYCVVP
ncbi:MAG TPA: excinuclease ABC subunit C [Candidatus Peribacter riflensis]|nr:excinuclease ABC subunit C [Candidatus Peribacter riflensis]HBU09285.1 excinuclease ABC subunit C [Candidatus Peribacter riflensis]